MNLKIIITHHYTLHPYLGGEKTDQYEFDDFQKAKDQYSKLIMKRNPDYEYIQISIVDKKIKEDE